MAGDKSKHCHHNGGPWSLRALVRPFEYISSDRDRRSDRSGRSVGWSGNPGLAATTYEASVIIN